MQERNISTGFALAHHWEIMFHAYFDESEHGRELLCVAGYTAKKEPWRKFIRRWRKRLSDAKVPYFHMKEFANQSGIFHPSRFDEAKRDPLINDLIEIILEHMEFGVGVAINPSEYRTLTSPRFRSQKGSAYTFCTQECAYQVLSWLQRHKHKGLVQYVFDSGHRNEYQASAELGKLNHVLLRRQYRFKSVTFASDEEPGFEPLQAADILAFETNLQRRNLRVGNPMSPNLKKLLTKYHEFQLIDRNRIQSVIATLEEAMTEKRNQKRVALDCRVQ